MNGSRGSCSRRMEEAARILVEAGVVERGTFRLSSGKTSSLYVDARRLLGKPYYFKQVSILLADLVSQVEDADAIIGVATGGIAWAAAVGLLREVPVGYVRSKSKGYGLGRMVEGVDPPMNVVILDDVATTGGSLEAGIRALREAGFTVAAAVVIVDREEGARERLSSLGVELWGLTTLSCIRGVMGESP